MKLIRRRGFPTYLGHMLIWDTWFSFPSNT